MKVKYHLSTLADGAIGIAITANTRDGEKQFFARTRQKPATISKLFAVCKGNIHTVLWKNGYGSGHTIDWDEDVSEIIDLPIIGLKTYKKRVVVNKIDAADAVYEVVEKAGVWSVIKHNNPLMTWDEAVAELKKRI